MAIIQSKQSILSVCLLVAFIANWVDAASLRGIKQADEAVSVDEKETSEDFYQMIVDEPFEEEIEAKDGERDLQFYNPGAPPNPNPNRFDSMVDGNGNFIRGNFANNGGASRGGPILGGPGVGGPVVVQPGVGGPVVVQPVPQPVPPRRSRWCRFFGDWFCPATPPPPTPPPPPAQFFVPPRATGFGQPIRQINYFPGPVRQPGGFQGNPLIDGYLGPYQYPAFNNFAAQPNAYARSNYRAPVYAGGGGGSEPYFSF